MNGIDHGRQVITFQRDPLATVAAVIRRTLRAAFTGWGLGQDVLDDALLVVEELVTNVVDHARTPFRLVVRLDAAVLRIDVRDESPSPVRVQELDLGRRRGRGLLMIAEVSARWGTDVDDTGKTVWAELVV